MSEATRASQPHIRNPHVLHLGERLVLQVAGDGVPCGRAANSTLETTSNLLSRFDH